MKRVLRLLLPVLLLAACAPATTRAPSGAATPRGQQEIARFASWITGTWTTAPGAAPSTELRVVEIWKGRPNQLWLYFEYRNPGEASRPWRQRIVRVSEDAGTLTATLFALPGNPHDLAGEWGRPAPFASLSPDDLRSYPDCAMRVASVELIIFRAGTIGNRCRGDVEGAAYERSEWQLTSSELRNLEQAYDAAGKVVAGNPAVWDLRRMSREAR